MPSPITHERQPAQILEMMERLGIGPEGGVVARLGLSYTTAFHRCDSWHLQDRVPRLDRQGVRVIGAALLPELRRLFRVEVRRAELQSDVCR